jgi:Flp pilus assembly protein TadG
VTSDSGAIVLGWLTKLAVFLGICGLIGFDAISLVHTRLNAANAATTAANAAAESFKTSKSVQIAYNAALATSPDATIDTSSFKIATDGTVTLRLHLHATTLLVRYIGPLKHLEDAAEVGTGTPTF